jgi:hypothetical protein
LPTSDSIPNAIEKKEKEEKNERNKEETKKEEERCSSDPRLEEGAMQTHNRRLDLASRGCMEPMAGHTQAGRGSGRPGSSQPPRPTAPATLFFDFFFMGLALVGLIFSYGSCFGSCFFVFHMAPATFRVIKFQNELTFHLGFSFESKIKF